MKNKSGTPELSEIVRAVHRKLLDWEQEIEQLKKSVCPHPSIEVIKNKKKAALLQYNATLKIARLGAELLERSMENRSEGLLFGLTKRPMFESYVRGIWFEHVADEERAEGFLYTDKKKQGETPRSRIPPPTLETVLKILQEKNIEEETVEWIKDNRQMWNDPVHVGGRSVWMGWSNEHGEMIHDNEHMANDLIALVEIAARCAGRIHILSEGNSARAEGIYQENKELRVIADCLYLRYKAEAEIK